MAPGEPESRTYENERGYRKSIVAEKGHRPHRFVAGASRWHGVPVCAVCRLGRLYVAHDDDLVTEIERLDEFLAIAVYELAFGPGDAAFFAGKIRDLVARGARLRPRS